MRHAEVVEWQTRCVQGAVSYTLVWVQVPPSAPYLSEWRNWQTRTVEGRVGDHVGSIPTSDTKTRKHQHLADAYLFWSDCNYS
jgi:hypothetical protein